MRYYQPVLDHFSCSPSPHDARPSLTLSLISSISVNHKNEWPFPSPSFFLKRFYLSNYLLFFLCSFLIFHSAKFSTVCFIMSFLHLSSAYLRILRNLFLSVSLSHSHTHSLIHTFLALSQKRSVSSSSCSCFVR